MKTIRKIGDLVKQGEPIAEIWTKEGKALVEASQLDGVESRGLIRDGFSVTKGL